MVEQKPLFKHFQEDTKLFHESFRFGEYWCLIKRFNRFGKKCFKVARVVRRGDIIYLSKIHQERVFSPKNSTHEYEIGDVIFFDKGGEKNKDGSKHYELVSSLIREQHKDLSPEDKEKIMKKYSRI